MTIRTADTGFDGLLTERSKPRDDFELMIAEDVDAYARGFPGHRIDAVQTGLGSGPNVVLSTRGDGFLAASTLIQFPVLGRTATGNEHITAVSVESVSPGSRWCEIDLEPGMILVYGPGTEHTAISPAGLSFSFVVASERRLGELAQTLGPRFAPPSRGHVHCLDHSPATRAFSSALASTLKVSSAGPTAQHNRHDDLLAAMARALSEGSRLQQVGGGRKIDSRRVCHASIEFAEAAGRLPSISDLCAVAHVSERRLRGAFNDAFGMGPNRFFRVWALDRARRRFILDRRAETTVARVAMELGFTHLGRFASHYRALYGEYPSATLGSSL